METELLSLRAMMLGRRQLKANTKMEPGYLFGPCRRVYAYPGVFSNWDGKVSKLKNVQVPANVAITQAEQFLNGQHNVLGNFESLEDLVVDGEKSLHQSTYNGILYHIKSVRIELLKALWKEEIYIGMSIIDDLAFQFAKNNAGPIATQVIAYLTKTHIGTSGFVIYPLHGFGLEIEPMYWKNTALKTYVQFRELGVCLCSQNNNFDSAYKRISSMASKLGVVGKVPRETLRHFVDSRSMNWFTCNPLMMVKIASHTGDYYENQFIYTLKIRIASALAAMLYALSADRGDEVDKFASSSEVNNWETLDIRHYLVAETNKDKSVPLKLRSVPMNLAAMDLARLSDLTAILSSKTLGQRNLSVAKRMFAPALKVLESGYITHVNADSSNKVCRRVFSRVITALDWYRQSFGARVTDDEAIVALAIAFETLLTDHYTGGVRDRVTRRLGICLKGRRGVKDYIGAVASVMEARGAIVHNGSTMKRANRIKAQAAFALCVKAVVDRFPNLGSSLDQPVGRILGDV